jgi:error-prone DNA polymerase
VVIWHDLAERQRRVLVQPQILRIDGHLEAANGVRHVIAGG